MLKKWRNLSNTEQHSTAVIPLFCHALKLNTERLAGGFQATGTAFLHFIE